MKRTTKLALIASVALATVPMTASAQQSQMTFFISSAGSGNGGNLGGLEGADALCARLAKAAGASADHLARVFEHAAGAKSVTRPRPHRPRTLAKRQRRDRRKDARRAAR